ncbi:MAG: alcohol dehydrogenase catalytic domain-containing protein [Planctomycetota bacterium]|jgi:threonine dehydrogenase-like Zn-dependent dehydrogenase|nr:alcohol dehydrogenase catalytic domain-containing protein [Planctomycetota bacterium]
MRAFYVEADWAPKPGYKLSKRELETKRAMRGNSIFKNIRGSVVDRPQPGIGPDEALLKIGAAGICGTDAHLLRKDDDGYTRYDGHSRYPIVTGHEFSGTVVEVGANVTSLKEGDLVAVESMHWCGECDACRRGFFNQCRNLDEPGLTFDGGFAEFAAIKARHCYTLNDLKSYYGDDVSALEQGAMIEPVGVAYNGLFVCGGLQRPGGHAAVFGAGPVGLAAVALLKAAGVGKLFCFETTPERQKLARDLGADHIVNPVAMTEKGEDPAEFLMDMTNGQGIRTFAECAGANPATYPIMEGALGIGGKTCQIGHRVGKTPVDMYKFMWNAARVSGSNGQSGCGIYPDVINLMAAGRIDMRKAITGRVSLENIQEGLDRSSRGAAGKILVSARYT